MVFLWSDTCPINYETHEKLHGSNNWIRRLLGFRGKTTDLKRELIGIFLTPNREVSTNLVEDDLHNKKQEENNAVNKTAPAC